MADNSRTGPGNPRENFGSRQGMPPGMSPRHEGSSSTGIMETAKEKAKDLTSGASDIMSGAKDKVQEWASTAADTASEAAGFVKDKAQEYAGVAMDKAQDFGREATDLVRRYPIPALLIGFGLGFLAARLISRA
jgi:ElaB/YqjD/DUF883 family membrane-anchored ribosome-binding protein